MQHWHAIGIFCEDIREEKNDTYSLMGVMPDNIMAHSLPVVLPKLGLYTRFNISTTVDMDQINIILRLSDGAELMVSTIDNALIKKAQRDALEQGSPWAGVLNRSIATPFPIQSEGRILLIAKFAGEELICGSINIYVDPSLASASSPPVAQSPSSAPES